MHVKRLQVVLATECPDITALCGERAVKLKLRGPGAILDHAKPRYSGRAAERRAGNAAARRSLILLERKTSEPRNHVRHLRKMRLTDQQEVGATIPGNDRMPLREKSVHPGRAEQKEKTKLRKLSQDARHRAKLFVRLVFDQHQQMEKLAKLSEQKVSEVVAKLLAFALEKLAQQESKGEWPILVVAGWKYAFV